jgi:hypothetical protein
LTLVLLDTNAYLRLAKRVKPLLGVPFGQIPYELTVLKDVELEVQRSPRLQQKFPWFNQADLMEERSARQIRLKSQEKLDLENATSLLQGIVAQQASDFIKNGRSAPSPVDCRVLAFAMLRSAIVVTDDLGMHLLAELTGLNIWHGHELLKKMLSAKLITNDLVRELFEALDNNGDLPQTWRRVKHSEFLKVFGKAAAH